MSPRTDSLYVKEIEEFTSGDQRVNLRNNKLLRLLFEDPVEQRRDRDVCYGSERCIYILHMGRGFRSAMTRRGQKLPTRNIFSGWVWNKGYWASRRIDGISELDEDSFCINGFVMPKSSSMIVCSKVPDQREIQVCQVRMPGATFERIYYNDRTRQKCDFVEQWTERNTNYVHGGTWKPNRWVKVDE